MTTSCEFLVVPDAALSNGTPALVVVHLAFPAAIYCGTFN